MPSDFLTLPWLGLNGWEKRIWSHDLELVSLFSNTSSFIDPGMPLVQEMQILFQDSSGTLFIRKIFIWIPYDPEYWEDKLRDLSPNEEMAIMDKKNSQYKHKIFANEKVDILFYCTGSCTGNGTTYGQCVFEAVVHIVKYFFHIESLVNLNRKPFNFRWPLIFWIKNDNQRYTATFSRGYVFS